MIRKTKEIDKIVGEEIYNFRKAKGISRAELAKNVGVTHQQIYKYESGTNRLSVSRLYEICDFLCVDPFIFLSRRERSESDNKVQEILNKILFHLSGIDDLSKLNAVKSLTKALAEK